ncbi:MAG: isopenicillin N synthase family oxygenase [Gammaproteobacteria bacterium]|nr:isopenicillin N synthase family oxygenase [Gammaproteobacteria bacterium]
MDILTIDYANSSSGVDLVKSLHETGFAIIKNHPIDYKVVQNLYLEWQDFFQTENKYNYPYDKKKGDGYVGIKTSEIAKGANLPDLKEFYQLYFPWGRYPKELTDNTAEYFQKIFGFAVELLQWLDLYTPNDVKKQFSEPLSQMVNFEKTMLRVLHYPALDGSHSLGAIRASAHEDINLITLLPASTQTGLQVKTKNNSQWLDVGTNHGEIIINVGDMLQECSNYYYVSTTHRVTNPEKNNIARLSMPLFVHPRTDVFLSSVYYKAELYLEERLKELGLLD